MPMEISTEWSRDSRSRVEASRDLDASKVQAPGIIERPGAASVRSIRCRPRPSVSRMPGVHPERRLGRRAGLHPRTGNPVGPPPRRRPHGVETAGPVDRSAGRRPVPDICRGPWNVRSSDGDHQCPRGEPSRMASRGGGGGVRLMTPDGPGGPRLVDLPDGRCRLLACGDDYGAGGEPAGSAVASTSSVLSPTTGSTSCSNRANESAAARAPGTRWASPRDNCWPPPNRPVPGR